MTIRRQFRHDWAPGSRRREYDGWAISADSPFTVFKDQSDGRWTVGHDRSGLAVNKLIPPKLMRSKCRLLMWLEDMAAQMPLEVAMLSMVESPAMLWGDEFVEYAESLLDWSGRYECI